MYHRKNTPSGSITPKLAIIFMAASVGYLAYTLYHYDDWETLANKLITLHSVNWWWGIAVVILLPINWITEAFKWQRVCRLLERLKFSQAMKAVFAGVATGFVTPNRIGDIVGRLRFLSPGHHKAGLSLAAVNSLTQNLAIILTSIPFTLLLFKAYAVPGIPNAKQPFYYFITVILILLLLIFVVVRTAKSKNNNRISRWLTAVRPFTLSDILSITAISAVRYLIFNFQLYAMLQLLGVDISPAHAMLSIPTTYLFISFTPSVAASEMIVRSTYSVLFIGMFSGEVALIALAGSALWLLNVVLPVMIGNILLILTKRQHSTS